MIEFQASPLYTTNKITEMLKVVHTMMESSKEQLDRIQQIQKKTYALDNILVNRSLKIYKEQNADIPEFIQQCDLWHNQSLSTIQALQVNEIKITFTEITHLNNQIIDIITQITDHTIDKFLGKEKYDTETALELLMSKASK